MKNEMEIAGGRLMENEEGVAGNITETGTGLGPPSSDSGAASPPSSAFELRDGGTYIGVESPEKRCGKTTLLSALSRLVRRPVVAANISPPAFFRVIEEARPTLLIDEADTFLHGNEEMRGILNAGYHKDTAYVLRVCAAQGTEESGAGEGGNVGAE